MITNLKQAKRLAADYNKCITDLERLRFLQDEQNLTVILDNDTTMVGFVLDNVDDEIESEVMDIDMNSFDDYHGWTDGVIQLFRFTGINAEMA